MVHDYQAGVDFSSWGTCDSQTTTWCCAIKDDPYSQLIDTVLLRGSPGDDILNFETVAGERLEPHKAGGSLEPIMQGRAGIDDMVGSSYAGPGYFDKLAGNDGNDSIAGAAGRDLIRGQDGNDRLDGNEGGDRIQGGEGEDSIYGGDGNDTYCDTSGSTASTCAQNLFQESGDTNSDTFWLEFHGACATAGNLDDLSDAGAGTDSCGPATSSTWGSPLPEFNSGTVWTGCDVGITSEPAQCP